ncbi:MAG: hypothetical protein QOE23_1051 [Pseudonocardiales bacterium]|jgi:hypothetical protein|nr:hypothetical protein [Pseudonocardiales bacterium]
MRSRILALATTVAALAATGFLTASSQASTATVDLSITGSTVAGYTKAQHGQELPVVFTIRNRSTTTAASIAFYFTLTHATAAASDYTCPLITNHYNIDPDTPACEPGTLGYGRSTSAAILVTPTIYSGTVTVKACAQDLDGYADPVSSNNCRTISIAIG